MAYTNAGLLDKAVEIAKEHARSGSQRSTASVLREVFEELKRINQEDK